MTFTVAQSLVSWGWGLSWDDVPDDVRATVKLELLDALGVAIAARRAGSVPFALTASGAFGASQEAHVIGDADAVSALAAAFTNGVLMHALDFDDTYTRGLVHVSAVTVPVALAVAERDRISGANMLLAMLVGGEVLARVSAAAPHGFHTRGFHATSVCGALAAAIVAARASGLTEPQAANAVGIAGSMACGSMEFLSTGASTKQIHPGWVSMAGLVAAGLARAGASGPETILEGERGLYRLFTDAAPDLRSITADLGKRWEVEGIAVKPYPACHLVHSTLDAGYALRASLAGQSISEIVVRLPAESVPIVCLPEAAKRRPRTSYEAKFSLQWTLAAMLEDGVVDVDTFLPERLARADLASLSDKVRFVTVNNPSPAAEAIGDIEVTLTDGRTLRRTTSEDSRSSRDVVVKHKFAGNVAAAGSVSDGLIDTVMALDTLEEVDDLVRGLAALVEAPLSPEETR